MPSLGDFFALKKAYDDDGFVVLRGYLSSEEVRELSDRVDAAMSGFEYAKQFAGVRKNFQEASPWIKDQFEKGAHVPLIAGLITDKPAPSSAAFFDKPVNASVEISQHVDGLGKFDGATIWIALDQADRLNGCLCYVKGSHKRAWSHADLKALTEDAEGAVVVEAAPGDAIIHSARCVHWSRKSADQVRRRRAVSYFYWASSCLEGLADWPGRKKVAEVPPLNVELAEAALLALDRDWAMMPKVVTMFRDNPVTFLEGLKFKDPDAFDSIVQAARL